MRVAISADDGSGLDSVVSPHFGRCPYYVLIDLDGRAVHQVNAVENPYYGHHQPGQVPGFIDSQGVDVMLAGGMGRRAIGIFQEYGIQAVTGATGSVRHALEQYLGGTLQGAEPCRESIAHAHGEAVDEVPHPGRQVQGGYEKDEVGQLQEEVQILQRQLTEVMERLARLA